MEKEYLKTVVSDNASLVQLESQVKEAVQSIAGEADTLRSTVLLMMLCTEAGQALADMDTGALEKRFRNDLKDRIKHAEQACAGVDAHLRLVKGVAGALGLLGTAEEIDTAVRETEERLQAMEQRLADAVRERDALPFDGLPE